MPGTPLPTLQTFELGDLASYTREGSFSDHDSPDYRVFYVGRDDVHGILEYLLEHCTSQLKLNMFGYDDDQLNARIERLVHDRHVYVQGTLDKSQAGGVHERKILAGWAPEMRASFAIGQSATHQISHTKGGVLDGLVAWEGSTNWSASGEGTGLIPGHALTPGVKAQNNTLTVHTNPVQVRRFGQELDEEHATALHQATQVAPAA
jgi:hypothetical protein